MNRLSFVLMVFILVFSSSFVVFANTVETVPLEPVPFEIVVSENDDFVPQNEYSITFAKTITINAETLQGTTVSVSVNASEGLGIEPVVYDSVTVGPTLKFMQPISLRLGDNYVKLTVEKEGFETVVVEALIKRKNVTIQNSLQNLIVIPGLIK